MCHSSVLLELRAQPGHPGRDGSLTHDYLLKKRKRAWRFWLCSTLHAESPLKKRNFQGWMPHRQEGTEHRWTAGTTLPREARSKGRNLPE